MKEGLPDVSLEERLVGENVISRTQFELAKTQSAQCNKPVWSLFVKLGYLSEEKIFEFFARESGIPQVNIAEYEISYEVVDSLTEGFCRQHQVVPMFKVKDVLYVACVNPLDTMLVESITKITGCAVEPLIASAASIIRGLNIYYGPLEDAFSIAPLLTKKHDVQGLAYRRESKRFELNVPVELKVQDSAVRLHYRAGLQGVTRNISENGAALNLQVGLFLPKGIGVSLEFKSQKAMNEHQQVVKILGEIVHSQMEKDRRYLLGVKFNESPQGNINQMLSLVLRNNKDSA